MIPYLKALHIIFVVTWFAGLFYIVRLFIYQTEAQDREEPARSILSEQLKLMAKRLWLIIGWPSAILTLIFGVSLLVMQPYLMKEGWMHAKLTLLLGLYIYHHLVHFRYKALQKDIYKYSSRQLRIFNEVPTLFLFAIVFLVTVRNTLDATFGVIGLFVLAMGLFIAIKLYQRSREKK